MDLSEIYYYVVQFLLLVSIIIMFLVARENYKDGVKREFKKNGKLRVSKVILYIILFAITFNCARLIISGTLALFLCIFPFIASVQTLLGLWFYAIVFAPLFFIKKIHKLVKYIVLAFPK